METILPRLKPLATAQAFEEQIALCAQVAAGRKAPTEASHAAAAAGTPSEVQDALVSLFLEAARTGVSAEELGSTLSAVLPDARARAIAALAAEGQPSMRSAIEALSMGPDQLVDVSWQRASVAASGRELPRPGGTPLFTITLSVRGADGATRPGHNRG